MAGVIVLTTAVVVIAHWIGLPFWWQKSPVMTVILVTVGYWLLMNVSFHYYMAVVTEPGYPPDVSITTFTSRSTWCFLLNVLLTLPYRRDYIKRLAYAKSVWCQNHRERITVQYAINVCLKWIIIAVRICLKCKQTWIISILRFFCSQLG